MYWHINAEKLLGDKEKCMLGYCTPCYQNLAVI